MTFLRALVCLVLLGAALPAIAQQWQLERTDDGVYRTAVVRYPGLGLWLRCHAPSAGGGNVIDSTWFESTIPPPDQFLVEFSQELVPIPVDSRSDLILFVEATGYRLPPVYFNELSGSIETKLSSADQMFAAMPGARRLVLQVEQGLAWELPVAGLGQAVAEARGYCIGPPTAATAPAAGGRAVASAEGFVVPPNVLAYLNGECNGAPRFDPKAFHAGDLDGDGTADVVVDWAGILCPGETFSFNCGAANCTVDLFLSSRGYALSHSTLAVGVGIVQHRSGRLGLGMGGTASVCHAIDCSIPWLWNGTELVQVP